MASTSQAVLDSGNPAAPLSIVGASDNREREAIAERNGGALARNTVPPGLFAGEPVAEVLHSLLSSLVAAPGPADSGGKCALLILIPASGGEAPEEVRRTGVLQAISELRACT